MTLFSWYCLAYETPTHAEISSRTINTSILWTNPELLNAFGLNIGIDDLAFPSIVPRDEDEPDSQKTIRLKEASIIRILTGGSVLEDEYSLIPGGLVRSKHHFFDPQHAGRGLTNVDGEEIGQPSLQWILEEVVENEYSY